MAKRIQAASYNKEYYLTESNNLEYQSFIRSGKLGKRYLQAVQHLPHGIKGPFLDLGCGRGELVIHLARLGKKAYGLDYSPAGITFGSNLLKKEPIRVRDLAVFKLADCTKLPFKDNSFQCLFMLDLIEHLTYKQAILTLKEARRVLRANGFLIIHTNNKYFEKIGKLLIYFFYLGIKFIFQAKKVVKETIFSNYEHLHLTYFSGNQLLKLLKKFGFRGRVDYLKPKTKSFLKEFVNYPDSLKKDVYYALAWVLINTSFIKFLLPSFWLIARKNKKNR